MTLPNVVIAGAPKCGTTSLFTWLTAHPEVCGSTLKETRFLFDADARRLRQGANIHDHGLAAYEAYFRHCDPTRTRVVLEATPGYLYQQTAPRVLASLEPRPRVLFILRNPSDRVYSAYHSVRFRAFLDPTTGFRDYLAQVRDGQPGERVDDAVERSQYVDYLRPWLECFPRASVDILLYERLREDPRRFMKDLAERLGIEPGFYEHYGFPHKRLTQEIRRPALHRTLARATGLVVRDPDGKAMRMLRKAFGGAYASVNVSPKPPSKTAEDRRLLADLDRHFAPYNARLARELDLDLSPWEHARS